MIHLSVATTPLDWGKSDLTTMMIIYRQNVCVLSTLDVVVGNIYIFLRRSITDDDQEMKISLKKPRVEIKEK